MLKKIQPQLARFFKTIPRHLIIAFAIVASLYVLDVTSIINCRERDAYDFRMKKRPAQKASRGIVILAIDDNSLQALGSWPWRRRLHAELIRHLNAAGAKAIFFDVLFPERSQNPEDDQILAQALREAKNVVLSFHFLSRNPWTPLFPIAEFKEAIRGLGYADVENDAKDGVVRTILPYVQIGEQRYFHSAVALFLSLFENVQERLEWEKALVARCGKNELLINYPGGMDMFQKFSAGEVFEKVQTEEGRQLLRKIFQDKIVLLGDVATGSSDLRSTPLAPLSPGIVIQASVLNTLITEQYLYAIPRHWNYLLAFFLAWLVAFLGQKLKPLWSLGITIFQIAIYIVINCLVFNYFLIVFQLPMPLVAMFTTFIVSLFMRYGDVRLEMAFLARELDMASKIQQTLLPATELKLTQLDAGFRCLFYERVGGDLYDWMDLGNGKVALCLGDVSGKGVPAALYMSRALNELRHQVTSGALPGEILTLLNSHLSKGETAGMFLTLFFIIIDSTTKKILYANAGHDSLVYYHAKEKRGELISAVTGLPIGIMEDQVYETGEIDFGVGDVMMLTSDGIKEQRSPQGEEFGSDRLQASLAKLSSAVDAGQVIDGVMADVLRFSGGRSPHDDRTIVCAKILAG